MLKVNKKSSMWKWWNKFKNVSLFAQHKRENGLPIFDLDKVISLSLAATKSYVYRNSDFVPMKVSDVWEI